MENKDGKINLAELYETAKIIGRGGFSLENPNDAVAFINIAFRRLATEAKPLALLSTNKARDKILVMLNEHEFIKQPEKIKVVVENGSEILKTESDNKEVVLDSILFDCFVYAIVATANPESIPFEKKYISLRNKYREQVFNDLRRIKKSVWIHQSF